VGLVFFLVAVEFELVLTACLIRLWTCELVVYAVDESADGMAAPSAHVDCGKPEHRMAATVGRSAWTLVGLSSCFL